MTKYCSIQGAEVTCSKAIGDDKAQTTSGGTLQLPVGPRGAGPQGGM